MILVVWTLDFGCVDIGFGLYGRLILAGLMSDFDYIFELITNIRLSNILLNL